MSSGGHSTSMGISLKFNRDQLKRRTMRDQSVSINYSLAVSRQPFTSSLSQFQKIEIGKRQKKLGIKRKRSNRFLLVIITILSSLIIVCSGTWLLEKLNTTLDKQDEITYSYNIHWYSDVDYDSPDWDYSPISPE
jgi:SNF family Na+-dependent transporter